MTGNGVGPNVDAHTLSEEAIKLVHDVRALPPPSDATQTGRARAIAITKLQEAAMWLNVAHFGERL